MKKIYVLCYRDYNDPKLHEGETPDLKMIRAYTSKRTAKMKSKPLSQLHYGVCIEEVELNEEE